MAVVMKSDEAKAAILRGEAPDGLTVEGYLSFGPIQFPAPKPYTAFTHLPDNLTVGRLEIARCANFRDWPKGLHCKTLIVTDCPVANLPDDIVIEDALHLQNCDNITDLPAIALRELALQTMAGISRLPVDLRVTETFNVSRCPKLVALPAGLRLKSLIIEQCEWLYQLPFDFETEKLTLRSWHVLESLPAGVRVKVLTLSGCVGLTRLPADLRVTRQFALSGCTQLEALPAKFSVPVLRISDCPRLTALPDDLEVTDWLDVDDCKPLKAIPPDLHLTQSLSVTGCASLERLPDGLRLPVLEAAHCQSLKGLPDDLQVTQKIDLTDCANLESLPVGLTTNTLILTNCTALKALPEGLLVTNLIISGCTALTEWPTSGLPGLRNMEMRGCTTLTEWPAVGPAAMRSLDMRGCAQMRSTPPWLRRVHDLNISDCGGIEHLPDNLRVTSALDIGGTRLRALPPSRLGFRLRWRSVAIDGRSVFYPQTLSGTEILGQGNTEVRRVMLERMGYERFLSQVKAETVDEDRDAGGQRRLLRVPMGNDEPLVCLAVHDPSTGRQYLLRVPPTVGTCNQAAAWIAGFENPDYYHPSIET